MFFAAFGQPIVMATSKALLQILAPQTMWARLLGLQGMVTFGLQPFASVAIGYAAEVFGAPAAVRTNGLLMLLGAAVLLLARPDLRRWETQMG